MDTTDSVAHTPLPESSEHASPAIIPSQKHPQKKNIFIPLGLLLCIVILLGCITVLVSHLYHPPTSAQKPLAKVIFRLNWLHSANFAGVYVAKQKGFYKAAGLDVDIKAYAENLDQSAEVGAGKADFGESTPIETLLSIDSGVKIKAIAAIDQISPEAFASLKKTNITTPVDLKGKVLGIQGGNKEAQAKYIALLNSVGLSKTAATLKDIDYHDTIDVHLLRGDADIVDLYRTDDTYFLDTKGISYNLLLPEKFNVNGYGDIIIASNQIINQKPDLVRKFVQATLEGWQYAISHQQEALAITKQYEDTDQYKDPKREAYILSHSAPLIQPTGGEPIGSMSFVVWNQVVNELQSQKLIGQSIDPSQVYTSQFIHQQ